MKQLLTLLLLATITAPAYADNNHKASTKSKAIKPKLPQQGQMVKPASADTAWHGTGKEHYHYGERELDPRMGRYMNVNPSAQPHSSNPYQFTNNKPIKAEDIK